MLPHSAHRFSPEWYLRHDFEGFPWNVCALIINHAGIKASVTCSHEYPPANRRWATESKEEKTSRVIARQRCPKVIAPLANTNCSEVEAIAGARWRSDCARQLTAVCEWMRPDSHNVETSAAYQAG